MNTFRDQAEALPEWQRFNDLNMKASCIRQAAIGVRDAYDEVKLLADEAQSLWRGPIRKASQNFLATKVVPAKVEQQ